MVEYDIPAMIHVSTSCNACFHTTGAHYLNADTTAFMQCLTSDLFKDFPTLKFLIRTAAARCLTTGADSAAWRRK
jgi:4-oxalmesaconate hydratase